MLKHSWPGGRAAAVITFIAGVQLLLLPITRNLVWPLGDRRLARSADVLPHPDQRLFGPPLRRVPLDNLTSDFEPEAYRRYYPDLVNSTDAQLAEHYLSVGRSQDRVHRRLRVVFAYNATAGLSNQFYCNVNMVAIAMAAGTEVALSTAWHRNGSFAIKYSDHPWPKGWVDVPLATLYNADALMQWAATEKAVVQTDMPQLNRAARADTVLALAWTPHPLEEWMEQLRGAAVTAAEAFRRERPGADLPTVVVTIVDNSPFSLNTTERPAQTLCSEIFRRLRPAADLQHLADSVIVGMTGDAAEPVPFNGMHLRIEDDAENAIDRGGLEATWQLYIQAMKETGFDTEMPLYVASGLLTYQSQSEFDANTVSRLLNDSLASKVVHKEMFISAERLAGLHSEALAMVDMLVLVKSQQFVGFKPSTLSWYVRETRCLEGISAETTALVGDADPVLDAALHLTNNTECQPRAGRPWRRPTLSDAAAAA